VIIDLALVDELREITTTDEFVTIGSSVSLEKVKSLSEKTFPALYDMLAVFGSLQIRNLATLGGNYGSASPIGDTPPVVMAYNATIVLESTKGNREIKALDFITGYRQTQIDPNEIIKEIKIPKLKNGTIVRSYKISKRKDLDISTVSLGARLDLDNGDTVKTLHLIYGGMAAMIKRAEKAETFLNEKQWSRDNVEQAMKLIDEDFSPISDARSGAEGRKVMARNLLLKFWVDTNEELMTVQ